MVHGYLRFLAKNYPQLTILKNQTNEGFANGYNLALQQVESEYFVLLNSDVEVAKTGSALGKIAGKRSAIATAQPKLLDYNRQIYLNMPVARGLARQIRISILRKDF
jgi:GT2 family glycosyltransferase